MQLTHVPARILCLAFVFTLFCSPAVLADTSVSLPDREQFHLFLLVGQSNMAGRGKVAAEDVEVNVRVLTLTEQGQWRPAVDPIHFDKSVAGVRLGRTFGLQLAELNSGITIGLIPCAVGGSPISTWQPGRYHGQTKSHPYDDALKRAKLAMKVGTLKGILWHQGESDSKESLADVYPQKLHELIKRLRRDLRLPRVPFIAGQMGQFIERPWSEAMKKVDLAHRSLPQHVELTAFVHSDGLGHKGDKVHFDSAAYRELGRRYARTYQDLIAEQPSR